MKKIVLFWLTLCLLVGQSMNANLTLYKNGYTMVKQPAFWNISKDQSQIDGVIELLFEYQHPYKDSSISEKLKKLINTCLQQTQSRRPRTYNDILIRRSYEICYRRCNSWE